MKVYICTEVHTSADERCQVWDQNVFTDKDKAMTFYNRICNSYRNADEDEWTEVAYSDHCSYFNSWDDEVEILLKEFSI